MPDPFTLMAAAASAGRLLGERARANTAATGRFFRDQATGENAKSLTPAEVLRMVNKQCQIYDDYFVQVDAYFVHFLEEIQRLRTENARLEAALHRSAAVTSTSMSAPRGQSVVPATRRLPEAR